MTWYFVDPARFRSERDGVDAFALGVDWLTPIKWHIDDAMRVVLDADIAAGGRVYPLFLRYPGQFPHTPPSVFPRGETARWSDHQFGAGGELCLEFGPDNWTPDMTGAQMIESAHRLFAGERPAPGETGVVATRHETTLGQVLRAEAVRLLVTRGLQSFFDGVPEGQAFVGNLLGSHHKSQTVNIVDKVTLPGGQTWTDPDIPPELSRQLVERPVGIFRIPPDTALPALSSPDEFRARCSAFGFPAAEAWVVLLRGSRAFAYFLLPDPIFDIGIVPAELEQDRLDPSHATLASKHVAMIGCGSLGSKVATMLARCGVGRFLLVDDDVLMPDNFVRNDLDWREVGVHKADAVAARVQFARPSVLTHIRRVRVAGQESGGTAETLLNSLAGCDLVFDATANPDVLNLVSAVAAGAQKPVMWAEVFGGGIGGLIVRCRPGQEPPPQYMRRAIENWFAENGPPPIRSRRGYGGGADGAPLIADDADVTAIAAHAARLAVDTLLARNPSIFPQSAYAIGLRSGSVFSQPFATFPIILPNVPQTAQTDALSPEEIAAEIRKIIALFEARTDETASAASGGPPAQT